MRTKNYTNHFIILIVLVFILFLVNISLGSVSIPVKDIIEILFGNDSIKESWKSIIINFRLPKALTAIMVGSGLSICGLLMQTLFRNPLAGPFVLGISSGASLGVAILILGSAIFGNFFINSLFSNYSIPLAASFGAFLILSTVIIAAKKVRNTMSILIIGLMFGSFTSAIISILSYFSEASEIQKYIFWNFGSLGNLSWNQLFIFFLFYLLCFVGSIVLIKPLNSLLLGENYAISLGINIKKSRNRILIVTSVLTGVITAFVGPIAFIGMAIPHIARLFFNTSNHKILITASAIIGSIVLLICDCISQLPMSEFTLPLNAVTSLFGAPIVIWLLMKKKKIFV